LNFHDNILNESSTNIKGVENGKDERTKRKDAKRKKKDDYGCRCSPVFIKGVLRNEDKRHRSGSPNGTRARLSLLQIKR
jgi:hypothetical protein